MFLNLIHNPFSFILFDVYQRISKNLKNPDHNGEKVNLLFITLDGARLDRLLNSKVIEKLCQKGTVFTNTIAYAPYTIAAMHAIFSGEYGFNNGVNSYWSTYKFRKEQFKTLTEYLRDNGFRTFGDIINELILPSQGFEELLIHDEDKDDLTERHRKLLDKMKTIQSNGENFFLYLHYSNIHTSIKSEVLKKFTNFSKEFFEAKKENEKKYDQHFAKAEKYLENILKHLEQIGLYENTLIVIISDHGISIGEKFGERAYGVFCYDYTVKTLALFIHQNIFPVKKITNQVRSIDIMPTILDVLEIPYDISYKKPTGLSLLPLINGEGNERIAMMESGNPLDSGKPPKEPNVIAIRKNNQKLIFNIHNKTLELYNLEKDPEEKKNLYGSDNELETELFSDILKFRPELSRRNE